MSIARERVLKLEAAMAAVGESDPPFSHLHDALKKAKAQCQVRPVEDRIAASKEFIERAKKRIIGCQAEVSHAQEALARVQSKLQFEEQGLADGEARLAALIQESAAAGPKSGGSSRDIARQFCPRASRVTSMSVRVTPREHRIACAIAVRSRRRAGTQTSQKFGNIFPRVGPSKQCRSTVWSWHGTKRAIDGRCFTPNGDSHRQRGSQFAFESIQPIVWVIRQAGYGLREFEWERRPTQAQSHQEW